ncbi:MAG: chemotaxis protein [Candidatus Thiodiazotropha sp. (ex Lucinoma kastoroae)]|nr:chemotaxis protein [Candidatus Thiodiazotropha sp. (ex Rostrolucina anterorostrata)]MCU7847381.1 chemotaxis protein [Candidatus Thiodiazotropha sp. (ex Lucinoma kastoroae)]
MSTLMKSVDNRTKLAGTNKLEVLLFSLGEDSETGRNEVFGINVFKVREVIHVPDITRAPDMPEGVEGMVSLRGSMVPVINLPKFCGVRSTGKNKILMITEYNKHVQGFLVNAVDNIERLDWEEVKAPPPMLTSRMGGLVTAVAEIEDQRLVMIMDVEKVLAEAASFYDAEEIFSGITASAKDINTTVLFADDSGIARDQIIRTLDHIGMKYISAINGADAWSKLKEITGQCEAAGTPVSERVQIILTDVEMPEMDGYVLTRKIKADSRFDGIPVLMHSSLSSDGNKSLGESVGADAYVPKFEPKELAATLQKMVHR